MNQVREIDSYNVVAKIEGRDPLLQHEYVIYTGHWDHMGHQGDNIFHGASDNASGVAGVLELAHAFSLLPAHPRRTVIFPLYHSGRTRPAGGEVLRWGGGPIAAAISPYRLAVYRNASIL